MYLAMDEQAVFTYVGFCRTCSYLIGNKGAHMTHGNSCDGGDGEVRDEVKLAPGTVSLLEKKTQNSVGVIIRPDNKPTIDKGIGFRVGENLLMTAYHVLRPEICTICEHIQFQLKKKKTFVLNVNTLFPNLRIKKNENENEAEYITRVIKEFLKDNTTNILLLIQKLKDYLIEVEITKLLTDSWKDIKVAFRQKKTFALDWRIEFGDEELDIVIVRLLKIETDQAFPAPLTLEQDSGNHKDLLTFFVDIEHNVVINQHTLCFENDTDAKKRVDEAIEFWVKQYQKLEEEVRKDYEECYEIDHTVTGRVILRASKSFVHGSSGSPVIYLNKAELPVVCAIYQKGYPKFYYDGQEKYMNVNCKYFLSAGTTMTKLTEVVKENEKLRLKEELFGISAARVMGWEEDEKTFVSVVGLTAKVEELALLHNILTITGCSGSGKTFLMHHVALHLKNKEQYKIYHITDFKDIEHLCVDHEDLKEVFVFDDVLGEHKLVDEKLESLKKFKKEILNKKSKKLLMTVRTEILNRTPKDLITNLNVLDVSKWKMSSEQRKDFLLAMINKNNQDPLKKLDKSLSVLVENCDPDFFPLLCHVYCKSGNKSFTRQPQIFTNPTVNLKDYFKEMLDKNVRMFCALAICLVYSDMTIPLHCSSSPSINENEKHKKLIDQIETFDKDLTVVDLAKQLSEINEVYINNIRGVYEFRHDIFKYIVACVVAEKQNTFLLSHCSVELCLKTFAFPLQMASSRECFVLDIENLKDIVSSRGKSKSSNSEQRKREDSENKCVKNAVHRSHDMSESSNFEQQKQICEDSENKCVKNAVHRSHDKSEGSNFELTEQIREVLAKKCVKELENKPSDKIITILFNSVHFQNQTFFTSFFSEMENSKIKKKWKHFIRYQLSVSACLFPEDTLIEKYLFPSNKCANYSAQKNVDILAITPLLAYVYSHNNTATNKSKMLRLLIKQYKQNIDDDFTGVTPLCLSVFKSEFETAELLIKNEADVNAGTPTPLAIAFNQNPQSENMLKLLINSGANIDALDSNGSTIWTNIVKSKNVFLMETVLKGYAKKELYKKNASRLTPFLCNEDKIDDITENIFNRLLENGADVNETDKHGKTLLMNAVDSGNIYVIKCLLKNEADVNKCGGELQSSTPLCTACLRGSVEIVKILIDHDADVNICDGAGQSPLTCAILGENKKKVDPNQGDDEGNSPLTEAVDSGIIDVIKCLLKNEADVNKCGGELQSSTPLCTACLRGSVEIVKILIDHDADVNICDGAGQSPLTCAILGGNDKVFEILLGKNADVNKFECKDYEIILTPLLAACRISSFRKVKRLLEKGANLNQENDEGNYPLTKAVDGGNVEVIKCLLENKADINICGNKQESSTPLCTACRKGSVEIVITLLNHDANVNICDGAGQSPLTCAILGGNNEVFELLLEQNADVNMFMETDGVILTPLLAACRKGLVGKVVQLFIKGVDHTRCDGKGQSPLTLAKKAEKKATKKCGKELK